MVAAQLPVPTIDATNLTCLFSTNCTVQIQEDSTQVVLPGTTGTAVLRSRIIEGAAGSEAEGLFTYLYQIDLTGVTAQPGGTCFSNVVQCTNALVLVTNRMVSCATNQQGVPLCATNFIVTPTNRATCTTNVVQYPCNNESACITSLQIRSGPPWGLLYSNVQVAQVFNLSGFGPGSFGPTGLQLTGSVLDLRFDVGICPGQLSSYFGFISSNVPQANLVRFNLSGGSSLLVASRGPEVPPPGIPCDFSALRAAIEQLASSELLGPNNNAREGRRGALLNAVDAAEREAAEGDALGASSELQSILVRARHGKWVSPAAAERLRGLIDALQQCLAQNAHQGG